MPVLVATNTAGDAPTSRQKYFPHVITTRAGYCPEVSLNYPLVSLLQMLKHRRKFGGLQKPSLSKVTQQSRSSYLINM